METDSQHKSLHPPNFYDADGEETCNLQQVQEQELHKREALSIPDEQADMYGSALLAVPYEQIAERLLCEVEPVDGFEPAGGFDNYEQPKQVC